MADGTTNEGIANMAEQDIYKAGYQHAIDDLCGLFDTMYSKYQDLWATDSQDTRELENTELAIITLNAAIVHLADHKKFAVFEKKEVC